MRLITCGTETEKVEDPLHVPDEGLPQGLLPIGAGEHLADELDR